MSSDCSLTPALFKEVSEEAAGKGLSWGPPAVRGPLNTGTQSRNADIHMSLGLQGVLQLLLETPMN